MLENDFHPKMFFQCTLSKLNRCRIVPYTNLAVSSEISSLGKYCSANFKFSSANADSEKNGPKTDNLLISRPAALEIDSGIQSGLFTSFTKKVHLKIFYAQNRFGVSQYQITKRTLINFGDFYFAQFVQ